MPCFYLVRSNTLHYADTIAGLPSQEQIAKERVAEMLVFGQSMEPILADVKRLHAGTYLASIAGKIQVHDYCPWHPKPDKRLTEDDAARTLGTLVKQAINRTHQKLGRSAENVFFSGGVDSAMVTQLLRSVMRGEPNIFTSGVVGLGTMESGVSEVMDADYATVERLGNEFTFARSLVTSPRRYHEAGFTVQQLLENLKKMVMSLPGGPVASTSFPLWAMTSRQAASRSIRFAYTGEGSDEVNAGYATSDPRRYGHRGLLAGFRALSNHITYADIRQLMGVDTWCTVIGAERQNSHLLARRFGKLDKFNAIRMFQIQYELPILIWEKAYGMGAVFGKGLQFINPYLDYDVMRFMLTVPLHLCIQQGRRKNVVLNAAAANRVPSVILGRYASGPRFGKQRTSGPWRHLIYGDPVFQAFVRSTFRKPLLRELGLCTQRTNLETFTYSVNRNNPNAHKKVWPLLILELWLRGYLKSK